MKRESKLKNKAGRPKESDDFFLPEIEKANVQNILYSFLNILDYGEFTEVEKLVSRVEKRFTSLTDLPIEIPQNRIVYLVSKYRINGTMRCVGNGMYVKERLKK